MNNRARKLQGSAIDRLPEKIKQKLIGAVLAWKDETPLSGNMEEECGMVIYEIMPAAEMVSTGKNWTLLSDSRFCINGNELWISLIVPKGFITDLDSVPRVPVFYTWLKDRTRVAALLHDVLYRLGHDRKHSDKCFLRAMKLEGVRFRYRYPIYCGVRLFGGKYYKKAPLKDFAGRYK